LKCDTCYEKGGLTVPEFFPLLYRTKIKTLFKNIIGVVLPRFKELAHVIVFHKNMGKIQGRKILRIGFRELAYSLLPRNFSLHRVYADDWIDVR